jgi:hypothetical protein
MTTATALHPQFVTNSAGQQTAVILPIEEFNELLEDLEDLAVVATRADENTVSHAQVVKELKSDGYLSD